MTPMPRSGKEKLVLGTEARYNPGPSGIHAGSCSQFSPPESKR